MKKSTLILCLLAMASAAMAQPVRPNLPPPENEDRPEAPKPEPKKDGRPVKVTPYGFVRNYFTYDTRNMYTVIGGEYDMLPFDQNLQPSDDGYVDVNDYDNAKFLAISTRIGLRLEGPAVWGARSSGRIEADFGGFGTNNSVLRIRLAYVKLDWQHSQGNTSELTMGQDWHPLSGNIMPDVLGMAAGAPFRPHSRTPQLRYAYTLKCGFGVTAAALYQLQYMYNGPKDNVLRSTTNSTEFANNAVVPELFLGVNYKNAHIYTQLGVDVQTIRPRNFGTVGLYTVKVNETMTSFTPTFYFQYTDKLFAAKFRTLLAQNTSNVNQLNGYGVSAFDPATGVAEYAPLRATISYLNFSYGKKYKANLFLGYMKNLGAADDLYNFSTTGGTDLQLYVKGGTNFTNLNSIWRIAPAVSYNLKHFTLGLEYEVTGATFGDWDSNGAILNNDNLHEVVNNRVCALIKYNF